MTQNIDREFDSIRNDIERLYKEKRNLSECELHQKRINEINENQTKTINKLNEKFDEIDNKLIIIDERQQNTIKSLDKILEKKEKSSWFKKETVRRFFLIIAGSVIATISPLIKEIITTIINNIK